MATKTTTRRQQFREILLKTGELAYPSAKQGRPGLSSSSFKADMEALAAEFGEVGGQRILTQVQVDIAKEGGKLKKWVLDRSRIPAAERYSNPVERVQIRMNSNLERKEAIVSLASALILNRLDADFNAAWNFLRSRTSGSSKLMECVEHTFRSDYSVNLVMDGGSTNVMLARRLVSLLLAGDVPQMGRLGEIHTNSLLALDELWRASEKAEVYPIIGKLSNHLGAFCGEGAIKPLELMGTRFTFGFIGASWIHLESGSLGCGRSEERSLKAELLRRSLVPCVLADSSKCIPHEDNSPFACAQQVAEGNPARASLYRGPLLLITDRISSQDAAKAIERGILVVAQTIES